MAGNPTVLVIDDEQTVRDLVAEALTRGGFEVLLAKSAEEGLESLDVRLPDLIILDIRLPGIGGLEVLKHIRGGAVPSSLPIILLTAESSETDRIVGLELGADDYVVKPFSPRELVARVRSVLRRSHGTGNPAISTLQRGGLILDLERHTVTYEDRLIAMTATEFRIVEALARQAGKTLSRAAIHEAVHETSAHPEDRAVDAHIKSIRRKLAHGGDDIETVRGFGYKLR